MEWFALAVVITLAMGFNYTNGFHDAANAIATSVSTRALTPRIALAMAAVANLVGAFFGTKVAQSAVYVEGISSIAPEDLRAAEELGYRVKLLGVAVRTAKGIEQRVHPTMVPKSSSIAQVMGVTNAVTIDGEGIPPITLVGPGAGGAATASAVVADIADVARGIRANPFGRPVKKLRATTKAPMERHEGGYYIRLMARDLAGTAGARADQRDRRNPLAVDRDCIGDAHHLRDRGGFRHHGGMHALLDARRGADRNAEQLDAVTEIGRGAQIFRRDG